MNGESVSEREETGGDYAWPEEPRWEPRERDGGGGEAGDPRAPGDEDAVSEEGKIEYVSYNVNLNFWANHSAAGR